MAVSIPLSKIIRDGVQTRASLRPDAVEMSGTAKRKDVTVVSATARIVA